MNLNSTIEIYAAFGVFKHHGAVHHRPLQPKGILDRRGVKKSNDRPHVKKAQTRPIEADSSPSDLASHHLWSEPSATDVTIKKWKEKRALDKMKGRELDPFEADAELAMFGDPR